MRVLLFTGKGGVGKTTAAAATAISCADSGLRTLVMSTDPAHSLADSFDVCLSTEPTDVARGLWAQQLDAQERMEESWAEVRDYLVDVFNWAGADGLEAEELSVIPGLDELFSLTDIKTHARSGEWDVLVVDCAPTAETIRLLSMPDVLSWYMERVFPLGRRVNRLVGPVLSRVSSLPVAGDNVFGATRRFYDQLDGVKDILGDPATTSVRLVVNPERMVIAEARRTYTYLSLFGYRVDAVIANRLLPTAVNDPWFKKWKDLQAEHMASITEGFDPLPVLRAELAETEIVGADRLREFAGEVYGPRNPAEPMHTSSPMIIERVDTGYRLRLELPFTDRGDLDVGRVAGELLIRVGPYRRSVMLPDSLSRREVRSASLKNGVLTVTFGGSPRRRGA